MANFPAPKSNLIIERSSFKHQKSRHLAYISGHPLNYAVEVLLPGAKSLPDSLADVSPTLDDFFLIRDLPIVEFVGEDFITKIMKNGQFTALSVGTKVDNDMVVAVLPTGHLILSVDKDTYQVLGLSGKPSKFTGLDPSRYMIQIDLFSENHKKGKKQYDRIIWALKDRLNLCFNFLLSWEPGDGNVAGLSQLTQLLDKYKMEDVSVKAADTKRKFSLIPELNSCQKLKEDESNGAHNIREVFEWIGTVSCDSNIAGGPEEYSSCYTCPEPCVEVKNLMCRQWSGLITVSRIQKMLTALRSFVTSDISTPWAALTVHGFEDAPISWWKNEHGYHKDGSNLYTFVVFPDETYWLYLAVSTHDVCP